MDRLSATPVCLALTLFASPAAAEQPKLVASQGEAPKGDAKEPAPRAHLALFTGVFVAGASLGVGSWLLTRDDDLSHKHAGIFVMEGGLTLAPLFAHGAGGEWERGAWFTIVPAIGTAAMAALLSLHPEAPIKGEDKSQRYYPIIISLTLLGSAVGIFDAVLVDERTATSLVVTANVATDGGGAMLGGEW